MPRPNTLEAVARAAEVLLEPREPRELADAFLQHAMQVFNAPAGFLYLTCGGDGPGLLVRGMDREHAMLEASRWLRRLADEEVAWRAGSGASAPGLGAHDVLAARIDEPPVSGLVSICRPRDERGGEKAEASRDGGLLRVLARSAGTAFARAAQHSRTRRRAEILAVEMEELTRIRWALERHSREIEHSLASRSRFFAAVSHELRTPINAIIGYNQLLEEGVFGELTERHADIVRKISASSRQLLDLVNDVLDLSKIEAGKLDVAQTPVDVRDIVAEATAAVELQAQWKGLSLRMERPDTLPTVTTDPMRVRQILLNLLSNAIKFTPQGSVTVRIRHVRCGEDAAGGPSPACPPGPDGWVGVEVEDTGVGIPPDQLDSIFDDFVQVPSAPHRGDGTGLGLAISSRLARLLGGDLTVDSEVGTRSTFALYLPCPARSFEAIPAPP